LQLYVRKCGYGQVKHEQEILVEVHELNSAVRFDKKCRKETVSIPDPVF